MNYYEHHLGDYAAATAHLSWDEDMAYTRLLRAYYHHERGIPQGQEYRLARAATPAQRKAVDTVLDEFFSLVESVHVQKRADEEVARYQDKQRKAKASANARWSQSERNANASPNAMRTHSECNALQTPDTRHQTETPPTPRKRVGVFDPASIPLPAWLPAAAWQRWCTDRKDRRKPITAEGAKGQIARLEKLRSEGHEPADVIGHAIASGYQGLFAPPKDSTPSADFARQRREQIHAMSGGLASARPAKPEPEILDGIGIVRAVG